MTSIVVLESGELATLLSVVPIARRIIELTFDRAVIVRHQDKPLLTPVDRYTPVDWTGAGGNVADLANPDLFTITRKSTGSLVDPGEAVTLVVTNAYEAPHTWEVVSNYIMTARVRLQTDFQMTARADYNFAITGAYTGDQDMDFVGYVVSQVQRNSLVLYDQIPGIARRLDENGTGALADFFTCVQEVFERVLEDIDAFFFDLCEIDRTREEFLDALLYDLGDPLGHLFDLTTNEKRKLAAVLVQMYREKGTCEGLVNVVRFFTGIELLGCSRAWEDTWRLDKGSYPSPVGDNDELGVDTILGPGTGPERWSFWALYGTPGSLTADELSKIAAIADYMKPAGTIYLGVKAP
jgi:phage tail-like protein